MAWLLRSSVLTALLLGPLLWAAGGCAPRSSASPHAAAATAKSCSRPLTLGMFDKPSGSCSLDVSAAGRTGVLRYPCSGSGAAEATFGPVTFSGSMKDHVLDVRLPPMSRRSRGCDWEGGQGIRGRWGEELELVHLEVPRPGQERCQKPCEARAKVTVTDDPPVDAAANEPPAPPRPPDADLGERVDVALHDSPSRGPENAALTVVTFIDYQCPFSRQLQAVLAKLERSQKVPLRVVVKQRPLSYHARAWAAARAALAAGNQGRFWQMHARLFAHPRALSDGDLEAHARALSLDIPRFRADLQSAAITQAIQEDQQEAARLGVTSTPISFVNGYRVLAVQPLEVWKGIMEAELARVRRSVAIENGG